MPKEETNLGTIADHFAEDGLIEFERPEQPVVGGAKKFTQTDITVNEISSA